MLPRPAVLAHKVRREYRPDHRGADESIGMKMGNENGDALRYLLASKDFRRKTVLRRKSLIYNGLCITSQLLLPLGLPQSVTITGSTKQAYFSS
jgi:hypothetical protein